MKSSVLNRIGFCLILLSLIFVLSLSAFATEPGDPPVTSGNEGSGESVPTSTTQVPTSSSDNVPTSSTQSGITKQYTLSFAVNSETLGHVELRYGSSVSTENRHLFAEGTEVTLLAVPKEGYVFKEWISEDSSFELSEDRAASPSLTFSMPKSDVSLKAVFQSEPLYYLSVERDDISGESFIVTGKDSYRVGETVKVDALPYDGFAFVEWGESCETFDFTPEQKTSLKLEFQMPAEDVVLTMKYKAITYYFKVEIQGTGEVEILEKEPNAAGKYECTVGEEIAISATPGVDYSFINWTGNNGAEFGEYDQEGTTLICPASDFTVTANFASSVMELTVATSEGGRVEPQEGVIRMGVDTVMNLVAVPEEGYVFDKWVCSSEKGKFEDVKDMTTAFTMPDENCTVTATFKKGGYKLKISASAGGQAQGKTGEYEMGARIAVKATPLPGYAFSHWTCSEGKLDEIFAFPEKAETEVMMPGSDLEVTAVFVLNVAVDNVSQTQRVLPTESDFPWLSVIFIFILSTICIVLIVIREKYNLSYRYLIQKWFRKES